MRCGGKLWNVVGGCVVGVVGGGSVVGGWAGAGCGVQ